MVAFHGCRLSASLTFIAAVSVVMVAWASFVVTDTATSELRASVSQVGEAPVAVIGSLPGAVSNGTTSWALIGDESYDPDGTIESYLWEVEHGDTVEYLYNEVESYQFESIGLYKITLTVTDNETNTGVDFTAVYSCSDIDGDCLPDWWELKHFDGLSLTDEDDPDGDGYSNLEEYARHTNPLVIDTGENILELYWRELAAAAAVAVVSTLVYFRLRRKRKEGERRKIEYAIEIQKALDEE